MRPTPNALELMTRVSIAGIERPYDQVTESWLREEIESRRSEGQNVCVIVRIESGSLNFALATPGCSSSGGGRPLNAQETEIFQLWVKRGMNSNDFKVGQLNAFLKQIKHI